MLQQQAQLYGDKYDVTDQAIQFTVNVDGHKLIEATANTQHAARSPAE